MVGCLDLGNRSFYRNIVQKRLLDTKDIVAILIRSVFEGLDVDRFSVGIDGKGRHRLYRQLIAQNRLLLVDAVISRRQVLKTELAIRSGENLFVPFYGIGVSADFTTKLKLGACQRHFTDDRLSIRSNDGVAVLIFLLSALAHLLKFQFVGGIDDGQNRKLGFFNLNQILVRTIVCHGLLADELNIVTLILLTGGRSHLVYNFLAIPLQRQTFIHGFVDTCNRLTIGAGLLRQCTCSRLVIA